MSHYNPELHDPIVIRLHKHGHIVNEIYRLLIDMGIPVIMQDVSSAMKRLGLKKHVRPTPMTKLGQEPPPPKDRPNPLFNAKAWLGDRLVEKTGGYWLDGRPVSTTQMIREYNRLRVVSGLIQVLDNPQWEWKP